MGIQFFHDFFNGDDGALDGKNRFLLHPHNSFDQPVPSSVGLLGVNDCEIRAHCADRRQFLAAKGKPNGSNFGIHPGEIYAPIPTQCRKREPGRAGFIGIGKSGMRMLGNLDRTWSGIFNRAAHATQEANPGIARIGEYYAARAPHPDHLVVDKIRRHTNHYEVSSLLPNCLVGGGKGNQMGKPFERHMVAIAKVFGQRIVERREFCHVYMSRTPPNTVSISPSRARI